MTRGTTHVVGAGLAGLAAAVKLVAQNRHVVVHELARHAGGRCRSYFEPALGLTIDNGNHLLLSGNRSALGFLETDRRAGALIWPGAIRVCVLRRRFRRAVAAEAKQWPAAVVDIFELIGAFRERMRAST